MSLTTITTRFLRDAAVTTAKIAANAVTLGKLGALTTKGDVLTHDGTDHQRLGVGTDDQVLTADSSAAGGLAWKDPAAGGTSPYVQLSHTSNNTAVTNNVYNPIVWENEDEDTDGFADLATDDEIITIPAGLGGRYLLVAFTKWRIGANSTNGEGDYFIRLYNRTTAAELFVQSNYTDGGANPQPSLAGVVTLNAGDEIEVSIFPSTGGDTEYGLSRFIAYLLEPA